MPQWAVLLTIASAVAGQQAGAGLERKRIKRSSGAWLGGHNNSSSGERKKKPGSSSNSNSRSCAVEAGAAAFPSPAYASTSTLVR